MFIAGEGVEGVGRERVLEDILSGGAVVQWVERWTCDQ